MKIQVRIGALAHGGAFVGDIVSSEGDAPRKKVFIRGAAPGELVEAEILSEEKNLIHASLLNVIETNSERIAPPCPWFGTCGGCDLQYLSITAQREAKRQMVERGLQFQGKLTPREPVKLIGTDLPAYAYRRRISLHLNEQGEIGFYRSGSGDVVHIERCLLAEDTINAGLGLLKPLLQDIKSDVAGVTLEQNDGSLFCLFKLREDAVFPFPEFERAKSSLGNLIVERDSKVIFSQHEFIEEETAHFPAGHFSQVNEAANQVLIATVLDLIHAAHITELYAGAGNFSIPLGQKGVKVDAVEADPLLIRRGLDLAEERGVSDKARFFEATCERYLRSNKVRGTVLLDPPRSGAKPLLEHFRPEKVSYIVYVSCSLPTLTRDLKELVGKGYQLDSVRVLDMFSQTHHVETISVLKS